MSAYDKISPTAKYVAYSRSFSDIPYTKEISRLIDAKRVVSFVLGAGQGEQNAIDRAKKVAPMAECRHKSITNVILRNKITQVIELASGMSPRGLILSKDKSMIYVETDLPSMLSEKKKIVRHFLKKENRLGKSKLFLENANALNLRQLENACRHFSPNKPVAIVNEGLMSYLTVREKGRVARNVRTILERYGGIWITPDLRTKRSFRQGFGGGIRSNLRSISKVTGRNQQHNGFDDEPHIRSFIKRNGFKLISKDPTSKGIRIVSAKRLKIKDIDVRKTTDFKLYVMRLAKSGKGI
jgi:O-methyltransferase involved in polyketide biosynthesis